jgi:uncharacterized protein
MFELELLPVTDEGLDRRQLIIYRPRARLAFVGNQAMADLAVAAAQGQVRQPYSAGGAEEFLEGIGFLAPDPPLPPAPGEEFHPATAVLLMTNQCQLRCTYCYAAAGEGAAEGLDPDIGRAAIDYVCRKALDDGRDHFDLSIHGGGEPTRAWAALQTCVDHARTRELPARITMVSNAIWSRRQLDWITENLDGLTVSVDGAPETQDRQRPFVTGRGSSGVVLRNLAELDRRGFPYAIRLTAIPPWDQLPKNVGFLCERTQCRSLHVEPAFNTARGGRPEPAPADCRGFARAFLDAYFVASAAGCELSYSGARAGSVAATFCTAPYDAIIVSTRGQLVTCYEVTDPTHPLAAISTIGRIADGVVTVDTASRSRLRSMLAERRLQCADCFCYRTCAGDCYARAFGAGDNGHLTYGPRCDMNRAITRNLLLALISGSGGVWHGL